MNLSNVLCIKNVGYQNANDFSRTFKLDFNPRLKRVLTGATFVRGIFRNFPKKKCLIYRQLRKYRWNQRVFWDCAIKNHQETVSPFFTVRFLLRFSVKRWTYFERKRTSMKSWGTYSPLYCPSGAPIYYRAYYPFIN